MKVPFLKYFSLVLWIATYELIAAYIGTVTQTGIQGWYHELVRPPLVPPDYVFPVVWTILYMVIAATGWVLWLHRRELPRSVIALYALYMALNWGWSFVFFSAHELLISFIWIAVMNIIALAFIFKAWHAKPCAAKMMILPTLWTCFAMYLNGGFYFLN